MTRSVFNPRFEDLPRVIPIFPLTGALLLPTGKLPLNIFEPRYLAMVRDALADKQRIIGMVQPRTPDLDDNRGASGYGGDEPVLYKIGCAGRITSFTESEDGRYLLTLSGVCRFDIGEEMAGKDDYRRVIADFKRFRDDVSDPPVFDIDRDRLLLAVKEYFATSSGDLVEGGRSQGFEYQGKYESVRNVGPAGGFGPGSGNFGMPPVPQMFQSQQQQRPAAPQTYQQHPPPTQMYDAHKTQYGKNDEFQREIPSQGILPNQYGGGSAPQARTGRQYQDR